MKRCYAGITAVMVVAIATTAGPAAELDVAVIRGPGAEAWLSALQPCGTVRIIDDIQDVPRGCAVVLPDRVLSSRELAELPLLLRRSRVLALGRSAFTGGGPSAAELLHVGKDYYYVPILYPHAMQEGGYAELRRTAELCARHNAHGMAIFAYVHTTPERGGPEVPNVIRDCFASFPSWKHRERIAPVGVPRVPKVLYLHVGDVPRIGPEAVVQWAHQIGANTVSLNVSRFRKPNTFALYDSRFTIAEREVNGETVPVENVYVDYLPRLIAAAKKFDIAVWANIFWRDTAPLPQEQRQVLQDGTRGLRPCPLSGAEYYDTLTDVVEEVLSRYPYISCVGLDEFQLRCRSWKTWGCFCPQCKAAFADQYGYELEPERVIIGFGGEGKQSLTPDFHRFRVSLMNKMVFEKFRRAINRVRPGTPLLLWESRNYGVLGVEPASAIMYGLNGYGPEYWSQSGTGEYLNPPRRFWPRSEPIVGIVGADGVRRRVAVEIIRVDCFEDAHTLRWGIATDGSQWPVEVSARADAVRYCAFDPLNSRNGDPEMAAALLAWLTCN